jgi:hypothetical protein
MAENPCPRAPRSRLTRAALAIGLSACTSERLQDPRALADAGAASAPSSPVMPAPAGASQLPSERLSGTGLYAEGDVTAGLAPDVADYSPRFEQWVDGATSRRFLWLPPAATIDTSDADHWTMPVGTRAWQELSRNGVRIETRFMQKVATDDWRYMTYHWTTEVDSVAVERGLVDAGGTGHDIPHLVDCGSCHDNVPDRLLGVSQLQLDHDGAGLNLESLVSSARLSSVPEERPSLPSDPATRGALGYLHANCGSCHNPDSVEYRSVDLELWLPVTAVASLEQTPVYRTAVGVERQGLGAGSALPALRISAGAPEASALYQRMASRDPNVQMPPIATKVVDASGLAIVSEWILSLEPR